MKKLMLFGLFLMCSTLTLANAPNAVAEKTQNNTMDNLAIVVRPEIAGLWGMQIPNNDKCVEYYNFKSGNQVIIKSADEWSTGMYDYQPSPDGSKVGALALQVKYDNGRKDCSGKMDDQSGEVTQYFVKWHNLNTIEFCTAEKTSKCFATLRRILP
ncbi:hypothetical protein [Acinetobacter sp. MD2(2019)]|uniref:hypothetical protein n=1 Tax=Acinetobacter sp. MD2(2019) TaxID=2605273 RepID=UPI002D1EB71C|nr:hypothetical protein [Acinetobacter sp. MD2(2019)]MEB3754195.1 hypothetical protein [Acinetobacter sp. MD2(2019)]